MYTKDLGGFSCHFLLLHHGGAEGGGSSLLLLSDLAAFWISYFRGLVTFGGRYQGGTQLMFG